MSKPLMPVLLLPLIILISIIIVALPLTGEEIMNYEKTKQKVIKLWQKGKFEKAINIYKKAIPLFPGLEHEIIFTMAQIYISAGEYKKSLDTLAKGQEKKLLYPLWLSLPMWEPLKRYEKFIKIVKKNKQLQAEATAKTEPRVSVILPQNYSKEKKYPLLMVLHGWNGSIVTLNRQWESGIVRKEFLLALVQSSQVIQPDRFGWDSLQLGKKDLTRIYQKTIDTYQVDTKQVIIAGFSQGGKMALDIALNDVFPVTGFVVLQPGRSLSKDVGKENLEIILERGLRGTIIDSQSPASSREQQRVTDLNRELGLTFRYVISGTGHWYPRDFFKQLDTAIKDILIHK